MIVMTTVPQKPAFIAFETFNLPNIACTSKFFLLAVYNETNQQPLKFPEPAIIDVANHNRFGSSCVVMPAFQGEV
jgi:hypothetical protein